MASILEGKGIDKGFGGLQALNQVDVSIAQGKITGLIGPNGAGKTTLFNVLSGFLKPDRGQVMFKNLDITHKAPQAIVHQGIARSWQGLRLFENLTVLENIMMSIPRREKENPISILLTPWTRKKEKLERALEISRLVNIDRPGPICGSGIVLCGTEIGGRRQIARHRSRGPAAG